MTVLMLVLNCCFGIPNTYETTSRNQAALFDHLWRRRWWRRRWCAKDSYLPEGTFEKLIENLHFLTLILMFIRFTKWITHIIDIFLQGHPLAHVDPGYDWQCDLCSQPGCGPTHTCAMCKFDMCCKCFNKVWALPRSHTVILHQALFMMQTPCKNTHNVIYFSTARVDLHCLLMFSASIWKHS